MEMLLIIKLFLLVAAALIQIKGQECCLDKERIGLLELKAFFKSVSDFDTEKILVSWVDDKMYDCCGWERVKCDATTGQVTELSLNWTRQFTYDDSSDGFPILNMSLFLPFEELQNLDLSENYFNGLNESKAYDSFGNLKQLKILKLGNNNLNASIFPYISSLTSLTTLVLNDNIMEGIIHKQGLLANLTSLEVLDLSNNGIRGSMKRLGICELKNLVELDLGQNYFDGHLPQCLSNLTYLQLLDVSFNHLTGNPSVIAKLTSLKCLSLMDNNFEGLFSLSSMANHSELQLFLLSTRSNMLHVETENSHLLPTYQLKVFYLRNSNLRVIPSFLRYQYNLRYIDLSHNELLGTFPTWLLHNNTKLENIYLTNNSFTGVLQLPNFKLDLLSLEISNNNFLGQLPKNLGMILPKLQYLNVSENIFQGNIPSSMGEMSTLQSLDLSRNNFSGELPSHFVTGCFSLTFLDLSNNNFRGQLFSNYMNMTQILRLYLDNNQFSGKIGGVLQNIARSLFVLDISNNMLSGQIPHWIGNFSSLSVLLMSGNYLEGKIPIELNGIKYLQILDISENRLSGFMASSLNLSSVNYLYMQKNDLSGSIPNSLLSSTELITIDLRENKFSGSIPHFTEDYSNLQVLLLGSNNLQGRIPIQLCQLRKIRIMDLSYNKLNGSIPSCFTTMLFQTGEDAYYDYSFGLQYVYSSYYQQYSIIGTYYNSIGTQLEDGTFEFSTSYSIDVEFVTKNRHESYKGKILHFMTGLDLSSNELTGSIPSELGNLQDILALNLSHNSLTGFIPETFFHLKAVESLDLSMNKLSGVVPSQLTELYNLEIFNVSYNNLSGLIPNKGQFANFDESNYEGNPHLCGPQINKSCSSMPTTPSSQSSEDEDEDGSVIDLVTFYWSIVASYLTTMLVLLVILCINSHWRRLWFNFIDECTYSCFY